MVLCPQRGRKMFGGIAGAERRAFLWGVFAARSAGDFSGGILSGDSAGGVTAFPSTFVLLPGADLSFLKLLLDNI